MTPTLPKPVDEVFTIAGALQQWANQPTRVCINLADGEPPMVAPWRPRMRLDGATLYVHPGNERRATRILSRLPLRRS